MYLIDSDVLIRAKNQHYAFDVAPGWWDWLVQAHDAGRVFTVEAVRREVTAGTDELAEWMHARPSSFAIEASGGDQPSLSAVSQWAHTSRYSQAAISAFLSRADYFLVAQAHALGFVVVTHELPAPTSARSIKIPDACQGLGVRWMQPWQMLRDEHVRFALEP